MELIINVNIIFNNNNNIRIRGKIKDQGNIPIVIAKIKTLCS